VKSKKDNNQDSIVRIFEQFGFTVIDTHWSRGRLLDIIVYKRYGEVWFVEIKNGLKKLTDCEADFIMVHTARCVVIRSEEEAIKFCQDLLIG